MHILSISLVVSSNGDAVISDSHLSLSQPSLSAGEVDGMRWSGAILYKILPECSGDSIDDSQEEPEFPGLPSVINAALGSIQPFLSQLENPTLAEVPRPHILMLILILN